MKQLLLSLTLLASSIVGYGQTTIKLEDVSKHISDSVTVCGKVANGRFLDGFDSSPTFLNLGAAYPDQLLTVVIWKDVRGQFEKAPEELYRGKEICVTGRVTQFKERPQMVIYRKEQIVQK